MNMDPGQLTEKVAFVEKVQTRQSDGTLAVSWSHIMTAWARVRPKSGTQRNLAQQTENPADYEITIHNSEGARLLKASDVIEWQGRKLNIVWIGHRSSQDQWLHIDAKDGVAT